MKLISTSPIVTFPLSFLLISWVTCLIIFCLLVETYINTIIYRDISNAVNITKPLRKYLIKRFKQIIFNMGNLSLVAIVEPSFNNSLYNYLLTHLINLSEFQKFITISLFGLLFVLPIR